MVSGVKYDLKHGRAEHHRTSLFSFGLPVVCPRLATPGVQPAEVMPLYLAGAQVELKMELHRHVPVV
jgi:hypothetical protein